MHLSKKVQDPTPVGGGPLNMSEEAYILEREGKGDSDSYEKPVLRTFKFEE